jgi:hypothetical protein
LIPLAIAIFIVVVYPFLQRSEFASRHGERKLRLTAAETKFSALAESDLKIFDPKKQFERWMIRDAVAFFESSIESYKQVTTEANNCRDKLLEEQVTSLTTRAESKAATLEKCKQFFESGLAAGAEVAVLECVKQDFSSSQSANFASFLNHYKGLVEGRSQALSLVESLQTTIESINGAISDLERSAESARRERVPTFSQIESIRAVASKFNDAYKETSFPDAEQCCEQGVDWVDAVRSYYEQFGYVNQQLGPNGYELPAGRQYLKENLRQVVENAQRCRKTFAELKTSLKRIKEEIPPPPNSMRFTASNFSERTIEEE